MKRESAAAILLFILFVVAAVKIPSLPEERSIEKLDKPIDNGNSTPNITQLAGDEDIDLNESPGVTGEKEWTNKSSEDIE